MLFIVVKWQSVYGAHKVQMPLPGRWVSAGTLVRNYGATNLAPTQKDKPLLSSKRRPHFKTRKRSWNEQKFGHGSRGGPKPRTTVLARTSSNILDLERDLMFCSRFWRHVAVVNISYVWCLSNETDDMPLHLLQSSNKWLPRNVYRNRLEFSELLMKTTF
jgi:hypothetical protein